MLPFLARQLVTALSAEDLSIEIEESTPFLLALVEPAFQLFEVIFFQCFEK